MRLVPCSGMILAAVLMMGWGSTVAGGEQEVSEDRAKAMFVVAFTKYVEWPVQPGQAPQPPLVIGTLGASKVTEEIRKIIAARRPGLRPLRLVELGKEDDPLGCHILYVPSRNGRGSADLLKTLSGKPVLTVGDADGFARKDGMIGLVLRSERLRPQLNLDAIKKAGLKPSSKLLRVSEVIAESRKKP